LLTLFELFKVFLFKNRCFSNLIKRALNESHGLVVPLYGIGWDRLDWDRLVGKEPVPGTS